MTLTYLLDTNIISEPLRPTPNPTILAYIERHQEEIAIAAIVWHELWFGCSRLPASARRTAIETYLTNVVAPAIPILAYDQRAAEWHAIERTRLAGISKTPPFADGQIAATAIVNDLILITLNRDDFSAFQGLQLDDWLTSETQKCQDAKLQLGILASCHRQPHSRRRYSSASPGTISP